MDADPEKLRIFNDSVHGPIQLDPLLVKIIDTPQFQRLRDIKQLGVCYWVYPGASHNRFEHCIGSSYICSQMINSLRSVHQNEKDLITPYESLCLRIAGLCRDLGYGPFSHFFHEVLVPKFMDLRGQTTASDQSIKWARDASCKMFDFMVKENQELKDALDKKFEELNPGKNWQKFIKDLIRGKDAKDVEEECSFKGINVKKSFLYEIVSNNHTRIDCNKFDYISRDCHNVGVETNFDWRRYLLNICVQRVSDKDLQMLRIHVRDKDYFKLYDLFYARWSLYHRVYRHKTNAGIEDMLSDAILKVDDKLKISDLIKNDWLLNGDDESMRRYTKLTDRIFYQILELEEQSEEPVRVPAQERSQLKEAKELLQSIQQRKLYKFCGEAELKDPCSWKAHKNKKKIATEIAGAFISFAYFHTGKEGEDPIKDVLLFTKSQQQRTQVSNMTGKFHQCYIRVYAKPGQLEKRNVQKVFQEWCDDNKDKVIPGSIKFNDGVTSTQEEGQKQM